MWLALFHFKTTVAHIACDCDNLKTKAVIDLSVPDYCKHNEKYTHAKRKWLHYELVSKKKPPFKWKGILCERWINEKKITGNFWVGSYSIETRQYTVGVTYAECKQLIEKKLCGNNKAEEIQGTYRYEAFPQETKGYWMSTVTYSALNCMGHEVSLSQDQLNTTIISPIGILPGSKFNDGHAFFNQKVLIWETANLERAHWDGCEPYKLYGAYGNVTHTKKQGRLIDRQHQLEVLFNPSQEKICETASGETINGYTVFGLPGAYLQFKQPLFHVHKRSIEKNEVVHLENNQEQDVEHLVWNPKMTKHQLDFMEAIESYQAYKPNGYIYPYSDPSEVLTAIKPQAPLVLRKLEQEGIYMSQKFKLENFKLQELVSEVSGLCVSVDNLFESGTEQIVSVRTCNVIYGDEWNKNNSADWQPDPHKLKQAASSEWIYDAENKLIIELKGKQCLTKLNQNVIIKDCAKNPEDINQLWGFEHLELDPKYDPYKQISFSTLNYDDSELEEYLLFIKGKEEILEISKQSFAHGRIKVYNNENIESLDDVSGCVSVQNRKYSLATIANCIVKDKLYNLTEEDKRYKTQDFEYYSDYTIRKTATNKCLDVLLPKKKSSKPLLFPAVGKAINIDNQKISYEEKMIILSDCQPGSTRWVYDDTTKQLHIIENLSNKKGCLTKQNTILIMGECDKDDLNQKWSFDKENKEVTKGITAEMVNSDDFFGQLEKLPEEEKTTFRVPIKIPRVFKSIKDIVPPIRKIEIMSHTAESAEEEKLAETKQTKSEKDSSVSPEQPRNNNKKDKLENNEVDKVQKDKKAKLLLQNVIAHPNGTHSADVHLDQLENFIKDYLKPIHETFKSGVHTDNENQMASEIRSVYCQVAEIKRNQLMTIAQISPILAAITMGMKHCERIEGHGVSLLLQECKLIHIDIGMFQSHRCGAQPVFHYGEKRFTIGKDGFSMHRINDDETGDWCFWLNNHFVNINGKTHFWKHKHGNMSDGKWEEQPPTVHGSHVALVKKYDYLPLNDYDFELRGLSYHEKSEFEQLNILMELSGRAQQFSSDHIGAIVSSETKEGHAQDLFSWTKTLRIIVFCIIGFILFSICLRIFLLFNPLPVMDNIIEKSKDKMNKRNKRKEKSKESEENENKVVTLEPTAPPPVYASLIAASGLTDSKSLNEISIDNQKDDSTIKRHNHVKCTYVKGLGLRWSDGCPCTTETKT